MIVGQFILVGSWLFDKNFTIYGRSNMCQFEYKGKHLSMRVSKLSYCPWVSRLNSPSRYLLWLRC